METQRELFRKICRYSFWVYCHDTPKYIKDCGLRERVILAWNVLYVHIFFRWTSISALGARVLPEFNSISVTYRSTCCVFLIVSLCSCYALDSLVYYDWGRRFSSFFVSPLVEGWDESSRQSSNLLLVDWQTWLNGSLKAKLQGLAEIVDSSNTVIATSIHIVCGFFSLFLSFTHQCFASKHFSFIRCNGHDKITKKNIPTILKASNVYNFDVSTSRTIPTFASFPTQNEFERFHRFFYRTYLFTFFVHQIQARVKKSRFANKEI